MKKKLKDAFVSSSEDVEIVYGGEKIIFLAKELGYATIQSLSMQASKEGLNPLALIVSESIEDKEGNKFTYDEIMRLKKSVSEPFFEAVIKLHGLGGEEKN